MNTHPWQLLQAVGQSFGKRGFVIEQAVHRGVHVLAAAVELRIVVRPVGRHGLADPGEVIHGRDAPGHALVALRAGLETTWRLVRRRPDLIGIQSLEDLLAAPQDALVGTEKLVGGTHEEVAADVLHVGRYVRHALHGIDIGHRARSARFRGNCLHIVDRAGHVARGANTNQSRPVGQDLVDGIRVELVGLPVERQPADLEAEIARE